MFSSSVKTLASAGVATVSRRAQLSLLRRASSSTGQAQPPPLSTVKATKKGKASPSTSGPSKPKPSHLPMLLLKTAPKSKHISKKSSPSSEIPVKPIKPLSGSEAGSLSLLDEPEPTPPRLSDKMEQSKTCVFIHSGKEPRPYSILALLEGEGFQIKGLVASVKEKGVFVDLYSNVEQQRALKLKKFSFPIKPSPRNLEYADSDIDTSVSAFEGIFESAARVKATSTAAASSPLPPPLTSSPQKTSSTTSPSTSPEPTTAPSTPTSTSTPPKPKPSATTPPPSISTLKTPKPLTPITTDASLSFNHAKLTQLLQASNVTIETIHSNRDLFKGEDGSIFAQVEIKGFPHRVYISTSLVNAPAPPPSKKQD